VATSIISFPQPAVAQSASPRPADIVSPTSFLPTANLRHRGLHLVTADNVLQATSTHSTPNDHSTTQAQADRIVAQVEREIARKAFQQHQAKMGKAPAPTSTANLLTLPVAKPESAASAAKRLLAALFSFAMPA